MSLASKWVDLVYNVATGNWKTRLVLAPVAGACYLSLIVFLVILSIKVDQYLCFTKMIFYPWNSIVGIFLFALGLFLMFISIVYFIRVKGTPVPFSPPPKLVSTGPYRFVRNPMLTGIFMQLFGIGIFLYSLSLTFVFTPIFIILNILELKRVEEPELTKRFGEEYVEYKKRVPMFFPFRINR